MNLTLSGKRVLITGASKGIGKATALLLAEEGCDLVLAARDPANLATADDDIRARHQVGVQTLAGDLSAEAEPLDICRRHPARHAADRGR